MPAAVGEAPAEDPSDDDAIGEGPEGALVANKAGFERALLGGVEE